MLPPVPPVTRNGWMQRFTSPFEQKYVFTLGINDTFFKNLEIDNNDGFHCLLKQNHLFYFHKILLKC